MKISKTLLNRILTLAASLVLCFSCVAEPLLLTAYANEGDSPSNTAFFNEAKYRVLSSKKVSAKKYSGSLRVLLKEQSGGYSVVQGSCTDGKYAYYLMVSSYTQKGRVLKLRIKDNKVMARSKILNTWHGNGMAYDSKRKKLVVIAREARKQEITLIDAKTLKITRQQNVKYSYYKNAGSDSISKTHQKKGLAAIAYCKKFDCYIALEREVHDLLIFDPDSLEAVGMARTKINGNYPGTFQGMDADEKYVYLLLSPYYDKKIVQPYNLILAIDWNSEYLLPLVTTTAEGKMDYIEKRWYCNNDHSGSPDAVIRINTKHEAESIYHTTNSKGKEHFYLAEYYGRLVYNKKTKSTTFKRDSYVYDLGVI